MKRLILIPALLLAACSESFVTGTSRNPREPVTLSASDVQTVKQGVELDLFDPDSARYSQLAAGRAPDGTVIVCGWVNARNRFGGYTGRQPFSGVLTPNGFDRVVIGGENFLIRAQVQDQCGTLGDYYWGPQKYLKTYPF